MPEYVVTGRRYEEKVEEPHQTPRRRQNENRLSRVMYVAEFRKQVPTQTDGKAYWNN